MQFRLQQQKFPCRLTVHFRLSQLDFGDFPDPKRAHNKLDSIAMLQNEFRPRSTKYSR